MHRPHSRCSYMFTARCVLLVLSSQFFLIANPLLQKSQLENTGWERGDVQLNICKPWGPSSLPVTQLYLSITTLSLVWTHHLRPEDHRLPGKEGRLLFFKALLQFYVSLPWANHPLPKVMSSCINLHVFCSPPSLSTREGPA